ncbi:MAG: hypothetical protein J6039_04095 [Alphaproteobacteria bacterium]|nr:hypothetical protein [Alphaproteobacteria bacterium]
MKKLLVLILMIFNCFPVFAEERVDKHLLNEMLTTLNNQYLEEINNVEVINEGMKALTDLDNNFTVSKGGDRFYIYYKQKINRIINYPKDVKDINGWVDSIAKVIDVAMEVSEKFSVRDFEIPDLMMKKMASSLDEYSRYYSEYEYIESEEENAIYTLYSDRMIGDILYLRVRVFNKQTGFSVENSLAQNPQAEGVILDLRGNSGGMFNEALKVANLFCDNEIITYTAGRDNKNIHYYTSKDNPVYSGPLVVIMDGKTASAAEVLAAGLQEQSRAKLVGSHSFGKGTIQTVTQMSNGGKLVLTTEQFFTPSGKIIHKQGVEPDICMVPSFSEVCPSEERSRTQEDIDMAVKLLKNEI